LPDSTTKTRTIDPIQEIPEAVRPQDRGLGWMDSALVIDESIKPAIARGASEGHWILDLCSQLPIPREGPWLSFGCGGGGQEMLVSERGLADRIDAFDRSPQAIEAARQISGDRGFQSLIFEVGDLVEVDLPVAEYDVVVCTLVLHRVENLDAAIARIDKSLKPGGWLLVNDYVGPRRFQFTDHQLQIVEELLSITPQHLRFDYVANQRKDTFVAKPEAFWAEEAPLEAISSEKIEPALRRRFEEVEYRPYGGTLLNPYLEHIVGNFDPKSEEDMTILRLVMYVERLLMREGSLASDFAVLAAKKPTGQ
jgi:SAM-dependent methyltransferase